MNETATPSDQTSREVRFVQATIARCQDDKGLAARLRRADNPATEYQSWDWLAHWIDLEKPWERLPWAVVAAAIARAKPAANGSLRLGAAVGRCFPDAPQGDSAEARLRRLLACHDTEEVCRILRATLRLIESRVTQPLDYARLLLELRRFHFHGDRVRASWAQAFYRRVEEAEVEA